MIITTVDYASLRLHIWRDRNGRSSKQNTKRWMLKGMRAFHYTKGWSHEVWIVCLALSAVLPPPKEERNDEEEENF